MFPVRFGIVVACDVGSLEALRSVVDDTSSLGFIAGYKVGGALAIQYGLRKAIGVVKELASLPVIYDHQKYGTDIPDICAGSTLKAVKDSDADGLIIFPHAGIETLRRTVQSCFNSGLTPIVGGEMSHEGYLVKERGYIANDAPTRMYLDAADLGVNHFIVPGTKPRSTEKYRRLIEARVSDPVFMFPGVGKGQGGDVKAMFKAVKPHSALAIVGRGIYGETSPREAASTLWRIISENIYENVEKRE